MYLLTGSNGFIGSSLIKYLELNSPSELNKILILSSNKHSKINTLLYDLKSYVIPEITDVTSIIHLGAFTPKSNQESNNIESCTNNIIFTKNLLKSLPPKIDKFIFISTLDVYKNSKIINEKSLVEPVSLYGWSKLYCEKMIIEWCKEHNASYIILRLGHIYGIGEDTYKKIIPESIKKIINDLPPVIYSDGEEIRSFLHVNDCIRCIWKSLELNCFDQIINIVSGKTITVKQLVNSLIEISEKKLKPQILNYNIDKKDYIFNNSKMIKLFGNEQIDLYQGLKEEYLYFLKK